MRYPVAQFDQNGEFAVEFPPRWLGKMFERVSDSGELATWWQPDRCSVVSANPALARATFIEKTDSERERQLGDDLTGAPLVKFIRISEPPFGHPQTSHGTVIEFGNVRDVVSGKVPVFPSKKFRQFLVHGVSHSDLKDPNVDLEGSGNFSVPPIGVQPSLTRVSSSENLVAIEPRLREQAFKGQRLAREENHLVDVSGVSGIMTVLIPPGVCAIWCRPGVLHFSSGGSSVLSCSVDAASRLDGAWRYVDGPVVSRPR